MGIRRGGVAWAAPLWLCARLGASCLSCARPGTGAPPAPRALSPARSLAARSPGPLSALAPSYAVGTPPTPPTDR
eukprot:1867787-Prymnesium_polylepis.1